MHIFHYLNKMVYTKGFTPFSDNIRAHLLSKFLLNFILLKQLGLTYSYMQVPKSWLSDEK